MKSPLGRIDIKVLYCILDDNRFAVCIGSMSFTNRVILEHFQRFNRKMRASTCPLSSGPIVFSLKSCDIARTIVNNDGINA